MVSCHLAVGDAALRPTKAERRYFHQSAQYVR
jgi:hypothetical protein